MPVFQVLLKADTNSVMEVVDPEVSVTCLDMSLVRKMFQLALLCTKRYPSERPTMHEVSRVLISLLPSPPVKPSMKNVDYTQLVTGKTQTGTRTPQADSTSDAQWYLRFGEVISKNSV